MQDQVDINWILEMLLSGLTAFGDLSSPGSIVFLVSGFFFVAVLALIRRRRRRTPVRALLRFLFPLRILWHRSARLDYKLYLINTPLSVLFATLFLGVSVATFDGILAQLRREVGLGPIFHVSQSFAVAATTILVVLAIDLGYWLCHFLLHRWGFLWEIHKMHHSAEVLIPLTSLRAHPFELLLQALFLSVAAGSAYAIAVYLFGLEATELTFWGINILSLLYFATFFHLRHSHIWINPQGWIARFLQTPAQHQIHHSKAPQHRGKNLGFCLSVWDWIFGTLYVPRKFEPIEIGIESTHDGDPPRSLVEFYWIPVSRAVNHAFRAFKTLRYPNSARKPRMNLEHDDF